MPELIVKVGTDWRLTANAYKRSGEVVKEVERVFYNQIGVNVVGWSSEIVDAERQMLSVDVCVRFDSLISSDARKRVVDRLQVEGSSIQEQQWVYGFEEKP